MGAIGVGGTFEAYDWETGINQVQLEAKYEHGNDSYSGGANNVIFCYVGDKSNLTKTQLRKFQEELEDKCDKRQGFVYKLEVKGYRIITTKYIEYPRNQGGLGWVLHKDSEQLWFKKYKTPCILVVADEDGRGSCIAGGTISELKAKAHEYLRKHYYRKVCYIVRKNKDVYIECRGDYKDQKKTSRKTDAKTLVLEIGKYAYFGIAPY